MDALTQLGIERDCGRLPFLFAKYADNGDHAALAALFTEDCEFARPFQPDHPFYGRDRVQAIFRDRPPILVRHIVSNVLVEVISETEAQGLRWLNGRTAWRDNWSRAPRSRSPPRSAHC